MSSYPSEFDPVPISQPQSDYQQITPQVAQRFAQQITQPVGPPTVPISQPQVYQPQVYQPTVPVSQPVVAQQVYQPQKTYKYFPAPPVITTYNKYQDVNNDPNLQHKETLYFLDKTHDWIKYDKSFKKISKIKRHIKGENGYEIIYKILKLFVKRGNTNWYDLKMQEGLVKDYIKHKLNKIVDN
jgi:hypothetical protein